MVTHSKCQCLVVQKIWWQKDKQASSPALNFHYMKQEESLGMRLTDNPL